MGILRSIELRGILALIMESWKLDAYKGLRNVGA